MKKSLYALAFLLTISAAALAQVHFNSGSARPLHTDQRKHTAVSPQATANQPKMKRHHPFVHCRDGSVSYSRQNICTGHGGARR